MRVSIANVIFGKEEKRAVNEVLNRGQVTPSEKVREFESKMARVFGKKYGVMVNSGSSANLLALYALKKPGMEVLTPALTFGTTVAPIIQTGMKPVFFDVDLDTYQIDVNAVETYLKKAPRAKRIFMIPALMGNFPDIERLRGLSKKYNIFFILDSCDTNRSFWNKKPVGKFADMVTSSFYSSHIITTGGGGGIIMTDDEKMKKRLQILRGWGRASAMTAESEKIEDRFKYTLDGIPYDGKLVFTEIGFNMQVTELHGAFGVAQLKKLNEFARLRKANFNKILKYFKNKPQFIIPKQYLQIDTPWQVFPVTLSRKCSFRREKLVIFLEKHNIQTRPLHVGNITRHPAFRKWRKPFKNADYVMRNSFIIGCHPSLTQKHLNYLFETFDTFLRENG